MAGGLTGLAWLGAGSQVLVDLVDLDLVWVTGVARWLADLGGWND